MVDDAASMATDWYETTVLLETLAVKIRSLRTMDKTDLYFTKGGLPVLHKKDILAEIVEEMGRHRSKESPKTKPNITMSLDAIFKDFKTQQKASSKKRPYWTLIILTNGYWTAQPKEDPRDIIVKFLKELYRERPEDMAERPFSIQFIHIGARKGIEFWHQDLDDFLREVINSETGKPFDDIIDVEPANGDINKMLLGSYREKWHKVEQERAAWIGESRENEADNKKRVTHES